MYYGLMYLGNTLRIFGTIRTIRFNYIVSINICFTLHQAILGLVTSVEKNVSGEPKAV